MLAYIEKNIEALKKEIPEAVTLIAVTKYHDDEETQSVVDAGICDLGESKVQDLMGKMERIKGKIRWHFIGHLQRNKVKYLVGKVFLIHSVHSLELLETIEKESLKRGVVTEVLIQFNLAEEDSKSGFSATDYQTVFNRIQSLEAVRVKGLMCIGPMTKNSDEIRKIFKQLKGLYDTIKKEYHGRNIDFTTLSMGMTDDYPIAIEEGATMVRIGRKIFYQ